MGELQGIIRFTFHADKVEEFKRLSAECLEIVRTRADRRSRTSGNIFLEVRRETTGLLAAALGDERLRQLRAEGEAMEDDRAIAYTLDQIAKALTDSTPQ